MAASAAGTNNAVPALCTVGDGAGAPTTSTAAVTPKLEQATRTIKEMEANKEHTAASAAGTNNATAALSIVGDGAGAPTSSRAAITPKLEQATRTMKAMNDRKRPKADDTGRRQHTGMYSIEELLPVAYLQERRCPWSETSRVNGCPRWETLEYPSLCTQKLGITCPAIWGVSAGHGRTEGGCMPITPQRLDYSNDTSPIIELVEEDAYGREILRTDTRGATHPHRSGRSLE
ncbi:hypothetical protein AgCh_027888 [Apium graveolens]